MVVGNDVFKKTVYDKLVIKVNYIDIKVPGTGKLVFKTQYDSGKQNFEKRLKMLIKRWPI